MRCKPLAAALSALAVGALGTAVPAEAVPTQDGNYGVYPNEGKYPEETGVKFRRVATRTATHRGRRVTLKVFYNGRVGTFARIDNAPPDCVAIVDRTRVGSQEITGRVAETVDPGISFAYTRVANNLEGRLARGAVVCEGDDGGSFALMQGRFF